MDMVKAKETEKMKGIFNAISLSIMKDINLKMHDSNYKVRIECLKTIFDRYSDLPRDVTYYTLIESTMDESPLLSKWLFNSIAGALGDKMPIEVRRDVCRKLMKNTDDEIIRKSAMEYLNKPVGTRPNEVLGGVHGQNVGSGLKSDKLSSRKKSTFHGIDADLKDNILCLTLWMGGDGAIFNLNDISKYLYNNEESIQKCLNVLKNQKIIVSVDGNYSLTRRGSILTDSILLKKIAHWNNMSEWVNLSGYSTIHHGFVEDRRNIALSDLFTSSRSFVVDYFQNLLENIVDNYNYKNISYFLHFRKILVLLSLNPTLNFLKINGNEFGEVMSDFYDTRLIKTIDYNGDKIILVNNSILLRKNARGRNK